MSQDFIEIIESRGFVHQMTDREGLRALLKTPGQKAYIGFDCTAQSLHVGSLLQIMLLRWWQKCGHTPIVLLGGGTTKIGDPSGKDESRPKLDDAMIAENMASLRQVFSQFLHFSNNESTTPHNAALMVNNDDWLKDLNYIDFLRDYGRHFSVNRMLTMDSVKLRLEREQPLSFLEFNYMVLQAYDFVELNRRLECRVQFGGSDQWGNITAGTELCSAVNRQEHIEITFLSEEDKKNIGAFIDKAFISNMSGRRQTYRVAKILDNGKYEIVFGTAPTVYGITSILLTTSSGAKMGKTAAGAVWLNADLLSPYDYWQFWRNTEDGDVERFLKLFTEISLDEIAGLMAGNINEAKKMLATEATALLHGREEATRAAQTAADVFSGGGVSANLPEISTSADKLAVFELLILAGFAASNGEAKRLIKGNGVSVNDAKVNDENARLSANDFAQGFAKLSKGKKQHVLVKLV